MPVPLHYHSIGDGEPVVILHGLFGSSRNWQSIARALAKNYRVITPDLRNHGRSSHAASMSYTEMAEDILRLLEELALERVNLLGHSMGGKVAMVCALAYPGLIDKLAVLDIAPASYEHRYGKIFHAMHNLPLDKINSRNMAEEILNGQLDDVFLARFLLQNLVRTDNGFEWRINLSAIRNNIELISAFPEIGHKNGFNSPALFLGGENSHFIRPQHRPAILGYFPRAEIDHVKNAGHMLHVEQPQEVTDRLRQFLRA